MDNNPNDWMLWAKYWPQYPQFFSNSSAASHFIQSRKPRMIEAGVLREAVKGYIIHRPELDKILVDLISKAK